jgi:hypothetical protein
MFKFDTLFLRVSKLSKREKFIFYGAVAFFSLAVSDRLILGPILSKAKSLNEKINNQEAIIKNSLHILAQKDRILKQVKLYASYGEQAKSHEEEIVFLQKEIERLANKSAIYVIDIKSAGFKQEDIFKKFFVKLNFEAQLEQLTNFFYEVENSKKLIRIEKYDIRPKTEGSSIIRCSTIISKAVLP